MSRELLQQALDALRRVGEYGDIYRYKNTEQSPYTQIYEAIDALNVELAKPEQEHVAWRNAAIRLGEDLYSVGPNGYYDMTAKQWLDWALSVVNTAPLRREWVGLTREDIYNCVEMLAVNGFSFAHAIESTLKDKNT